MLSDVIQWDVATWKHSLSFWEKRVGDLDGKLGLEIGSCGGGLSLLLALSGCRMVCSDLLGPTVRARELHRQYGVDGLITYDRVDARRIPFGNEQFDLVAMKSVLGALGNVEGRLKAQHEAISEIRRVLKPGGVFLFAENTRGSPMHAALRERFMPWGRDWHYFTVGEVGELLSGFASVDLSFRGFAATLGRREWQRSVLHSLDWALVPLVPTGLRYVVFGFAMK
jgi:SAM-dependent methyltransferase